MAAETYDTKCHELATKWLADYDMSMQYAGAETLRHLLAVRIQGVLESFVGDYGLDVRKKNVEGN